MSIKDNKRKQFGDFAEGLASKYLESKGYEVITRNYRKPWGEIDIIAFKDGVCVFVEVKANSREFAGNFNPELRVDHRKLDKITKTAELFMAGEWNRTTHDWQVDIVSVTIIESTKKAKITHFKNVTEARF
jgi:putative endonuclease